MTFAGHVLTVSGLGLLVATLSRSRGRATTHWRVGGWVPALIGTTTRGLAFSGIACMPPVFQQQTPVVQVEDSWD